MDLRLSRHPTGLAAAGRSEILNPFTLPRQLRKKAPESPAAAAANRHSGVRLRAHVVRKSRAQERSAPTAPVLLPHQQQHPAAATRGCMDITLAGMRLRGADSGSPKWNRGARMRKSL